MKPILIPDFDVFDVALSSFATSFKEQAKEVSFETAERELVDVVLYVGLFGNYSVETSENTFFVYKGAVSGEDCVLFVKSEIAGSWLSLRIRDRINFYADALNSFFTGVVKTYVEIYYDFSSIPQALYTQGLK